MKSIFTLLSFFAITVGFSQDSEKVTIPDGVTYKYADNKVIEKAKKLVRENLSDKPNYKILQSTLIIGPELWKRFKDSKEIHKIEEGNVDFHVDDLILKGKMTQDLDDAKIVWDELRKEITESYTIRKATENELKYYWSVISFDIDEPLLILETKSHNYILNLLKDDLKLMWLDEAPTVEYVATKPKMVTYQNGEEVETISEGIKETKLEKMFLLSSNDDLEKNTSIEDLSSIIDKCNAIFDELFKNSMKPGKIMVEFELKKDKNEIQFAVRDDLDLDIMKEFEKRITAETFPKSKKDPIKFRLVYKVNSLNDTE